MSTDISKENAAFIEKLVEDGAFDDEGEALNEAVGLLKMRQKLRNDV